MIKKIQTKEVYYMPSTLEEGILYYSKEFDIAIHLCACGCGSKVRTPLGETDWSIEISNNGPSLYPSIGNWQQSCKSHYLIRGGMIIWAEEWTQEKIEYGRNLEQQRSGEYYRKMYSKQNIFLRFIEKIRSFF